MARDGEYPPLADHGLIGDGHTSALVAPDGSIDWWCPDRIDAPSAFARLLDREKGGHFLLRVEDAQHAELAYEPATNVLRTRWRTAAGHATVHDLMPVDRHGEPADGRSRILRFVHCEEGEVELLAEFAPALEYARERPRLRAVDGGGIAAGGKRAILLGSTLPLRLVDDALRCEARLESGESAAFLVQSAAADAERVATVDVQAAGELLRDTRRFWREWSQRCEYQGDYRDTVIRNVLALKLLHHTPTGALVAAPTTSLPEEIGGVRNWDYRYGWIRDSAFAVLAFHQAGHDEDAARLAHWVGGLLENSGPEQLRIMYRVDGTTDLDEESLDHLEGYRGSAPVRVGNEAVEQWQLDVLGELVDCLHLCRAIGVHEEEIEWDRVRALVEHVRASWHQRDSGIWETRSEPRHFVVSKLMSWLALDRGIQAIENLGMDGPLDEWRAAREEIREDIIKHGYDEERGAFVIAYGEKALDGANLLIPLLGMLPAQDARVVSTVERTLEELTENGLVYRYRDFDDGVQGNEATFSICTCWLVEALAQMGRVEEAKEIFESLLGHAGRTGLFAEQIAPGTGEQLGNYPQALTLIGIISAAAAITNAEGGQERPPVHRKPQARAGAS